MCFRNVSVKQRKNETNLLHQSKDLYLHNNAKALPKYWLSKCEYSKISEETNIPHLALHATGPTPSKRTNTWLILFLTCNVI